METTAYPVQLLPTPPISYTTKGPSSMDKYIPIDHPWVVSSEAPIYEVAFPPSTADEALRSYFDSIEAWSRRVN
jgi:hypothetical protein